MTIETIALRLNNAKRVVVFTGAGVSAESGIPTFRDAQTGLWAKYDPTELATPDAFERNPKLVWDWYEWRRELCRDAKPNPGHYALAELEKRFEHFVVATQNIDGLHRAAGSRDVIELHGNLQRDKCSRDGEIINRNDARVTENGLLKCPRCGAFLRPAVVWFGESLPHDELNRAFQKSSHCDLFFSIGTSGLVEPAASLPRVAKQAGAFLVEINPDETPLSPMADAVVRAKSGEALPMLINALN
jgi:NAD-dependent deacetylase